MMVYVVLYQDWDENRIDEIFATKEQAEKFIAAKPEVYYLHNAVQELRNSFVVEEFEVRGINGTERPETESEKPAEDHGQETQGAEESS